MVVQLGDTLKIMVENKNGYINKYQKYPKAMAMGYRDQVRNQNLTKLIGPFGQVGGAKVGCSEIFETNAETEP
jgi:hypothetical protein